MSAGCDKFGECVVSPQQYRDLTNMIAESGPGLAAKHKDVTPAGRTNDPITVDLSGDWD